MRLLFGIIMTLSVAVSPASADQTRPNIVFVMADDHANSAISCYGGSAFKTPHLDELAAQGVKFEQMVVTNALCAPSRAVLLTSKYTHLNGLRRNNDRFDGTQPTFPKQLQAAGYETAIVGKWHLTTQPIGFDYYNVLPHQGHFFDCKLKESGTEWKNGKAGGVVRKGYLTDQLTDVAIDWLENRDSGQPFCLMLHHKAPHNPHVPAARHEKLYADHVFPEPANLLDGYDGRIFETLAETLEIRLQECNYPKYKKQASLAKEMDADEGTRFMYQEFMKGYGRLVAGLDENIGRLMKHLDGSGLRDNTILIYTSDNGFFLGEHGFYSKQLILEESMRVPLIVRWPGVVEAGTRCDELVSMLDIGPTLVEIAGGTIPSEFQGRSMLPLLKDESVPWREAAYYHNYGTRTLPEQFGVRTKTHKLIHYPKVEGPYQWELFNLTDDPGEMKNIFGNPSAVATQAELHEKLLTLVGQFNDDTAKIAK